MNQIRLIQSNIDKEYAKRTETKMEELNQCKEFLGLTEE